MIPSPDMQEIQSTGAPMSGKCNRLWMLWLSPDALATLDAGHKSSSLSGGLLRLSTGTASRFTGKTKAVERLRTSGGSVFLLSALENLRSLPADWNGYGADSPNPRSRAQAKLILLEMISASLIPDRVVASAEGGVGLYLKRGERYVVVESLNDGTVTAVGSDRAGHFETWTIAPEPAEIERALDEISVFLDG